MSSPAAILSNRRARVSQTCFATPWAYPQTSSTMGSTSRGSASYSVLRSVFFSASCPSTRRRNSRLSSKSHIRTGIGSRAVLSVYAGPMPRRVVPILAAPLASSCSASSSRWYGMITCALPLIRRLSQLIPRRVSPSYSCARHSGSITVPSPMMQSVSGYRMPEGIRCSLYSSWSTTTVCPALLPP